MTNSIDEIEFADCILVTGSNTTEAHPIIGIKVKRAVARGARLILVDPRSIELADFATVHMKQRPGTDVAWLNGMMNVILAEGLEDQEFIDSRCENFDEFKKTIEQYTPERVEEITGIPADQLREAARVYARAGTATMLYSMGITQHTTGVDNVLSCANLAMITGNVGKASAGVNPLRGQNNVQGACDLGALPNVYPGYQQVASEEIQKKFSDAWGVKVSDRGVGMTITDMFGAAGGKLKAMFVLAENPVLSDADQQHVEQALKALDFMVVQDIFFTETAPFADIILPGASFAEKDGTFTNSERRVQRVRKVIEPLPGTRPDWVILMELAQKFGFDWSYGDPEEIFDEFVGLTPIYGGIDYKRIDKIGLQWPCPDKEHPGTLFLHKDKFSRGKGLLSPIEFKEPNELPDAEYPLTLTTGRMLYHFHTGTMSRRSQGLNEHVPEGYFEINTADACELGIENEEKVRVATRRGEVEALAFVSDRPMKGVIFMPFHFHESPANRLTNPACDPVAKIPEFKVCAARVQKL